MIMRGIAATAHPGRTMIPRETREFQVCKNALASTRWVAYPGRPTADGELCVRIDRCAYTSNNITYAAFGDSLRYWEFFPAHTAGDAAGTDTGDLNWGIVPVWGFGTVQASGHAEVQVGERLYGYWPTATHAVLLPQRVTDAGFTDGTPHRAELAAVYNQYTRCSRDPFYTADSEDMQALMRPLFTTAWLIDDFLADQEYFGAKVAQASGAARARVLLSSASSKTAYATAALMAQRADVELIGLTSTRNVGFCQSLGLYGQVLGYEQLDALAADVPSVYVDFAGNAGLRQAIHSRFTRLAYSCAVGGTHVAQLSGSRDLAGPRPVLFFAPTQVKKRVGEWGPGPFTERLVAAWHAFRARSAQGPQPWLVVQVHTGPQAVQAAHAAVLAGQGDARAGHILTP